MSSLDLLKTKIHDLLLEKSGEPDAADLMLVNREAQEHGLDNRQFDRLLQEVYGSINWAKIRDEQEGEDRVNGEPIKIFEVEVKSLNKLGEVLFNNKDKALKYLADDVYLKANVNFLSNQNIDTAMAYADLYEAETDKERRYLNICYRLNPKLPYRIGKSTFTSIKELLIEGFEKTSLMKSIYQEYRLGRLQIWLLAFNSQQLDFDPHDRSFVGFLTIVYQINAAFPFYLGERLFHTVTDLTSAALTSLETGKEVLESFANGSLLVWLAALGHPEWREGYIELFKKVHASDFLNEDEKDFVLMQELAFMMDDQADHPVIEISQTSIENLQLAATKAVDIPIWLNLKSAGFVKPLIRLQPKIEGLVLDKTHATLFSITGQQQEAVTLTIDPQKLAKDVEYQTVLQIISDYQTLDIPVRLKTVFPLHTYLLYLAKYSVFGALFFALFRWLLAVCTGNSGALPPQIITTDVSRSLPDNYAGFYWVFIVMISSAIVSVFLIRKVEKI